MQKKDRIILHIDMDAFFASVEQKCSPPLKDKPIAVIGSGGRTVVTTASYQARAYGVKTGMTVYEAKRACPSIRLIIGDNRKYTDTSCRIIKILRDITPQVEAYSIDEAFLDITGCDRLFGSPEEIAARIKASISRELGLSCSIGIAPSKLLAKLASDMKKPDGIFRICPQDIPNIMEDLPVEELCGIGTRLARALSHLGIKTCGQLGRMPVDILSKRFGIIGERLKMMGQGRDDSPVIPIEKEEETKSVGHSMTFEHDILERGDMLRQLLQLSQMVGRRARAYRLAGRTIALTIRYADFHTFTTRKTIKHPINGSHDIWKVACEILSAVYLTQPVRLLGISLTNLSPQAKQLPLFGWHQRHDEVCKVMDQINDRFGENSIIWAEMLPNRIKEARIISPSWRPQGVRNVDVK